jgi:ribokinase
VEAKVRVEVAVVGTVNLDYTVHVPRLPDRGETVMGDEVSTAPGGKGANQAVAAARQGARTALVACVGEDPAGDEVLDFLGREQGLDVRAVRRVAGANTGSALITVDGAGGNMIVTARGANRFIDDAYVHRHGRSIGDAAVLLVQLGIPSDGVRAALEIARSVGTITVLDPSPVDDLAVDTLRLVDVLVPNEAEAARLTGVDIGDADDARRAAEVLIARGCAGVVVTMAERGALCVSGSRNRPEHAWIPPFPVDVVDPTAAGDAFAGALAAALARGAPLVDALRDAAAAGAIATTVAGAGPSLPTRRAVEEMRKTATI